MKKIVTLLLFPLLSACSTAQMNDQNPAIDGAAAYTMLPDHVNDTQREWSYNPKSTTVIGVPFTPAPVQVTYDGSIYTGKAELCFFYGSSNKPTAAYQKTFYKGWIPIVEYDWLEDGIRYDMEMFGSSLPGEDSKNSVQFVRVLIKNVSDQKQQAIFSTGTRSSGLDHRMGQAEFSEQFSYRFDKNEFIRDNQLLYTFEGEPEKYAIKNKPYTGPYQATDLGIKVNTVTGLTRYSKQLNPEESYQLTFKFPRVPVGYNETAFLAKLRQAAYVESRQACIDYWKERIEGGGYFVIPEDRVEDSFKASLVHLMLATRMEKDGTKRQGSGLPYDGIFFNDFIDMRLAYDTGGHTDFVELNFPWMFKNINEEGLFVDPSVSHSQEIMTSHGQVLFSLCNHFLYTQNRTLAEEVFGPVSQAIEMIKHDHNKEPNGLVRPSTPFDAEMIKGYYTSHNLWCLLGLRSAITLADYLGKDKESREWRELEKSYYNAIMKGIDTSAYADGYVPTGLYKYLTGDVARKGFKEFQTDQDWENMLLVYPTETLEPGDNRVKGTLNHIRTHKYREGIMTYRNGMHLHQYATTNLANQYLAINDQEKVLLDMYHILLHNGSTHEGFENMVEPWSDRDPDPIPAPHAWAAAKTSLLIRNMLVREYGGKAGINKGERSLYLFSSLSPSWVQPGKQIEIRDIRSEFGKINAVMTCKQEGANIRLNCDYANFKPACIYIAVPYYKQIDQVTSDVGEVKIEDGYMIFSPETKEIQIHWKDNKQSKKNYVQEILKSYRTEPGVAWEDCPEDKGDCSPADAGCNLIVIPGTEEGFLTPEEEKIEAEPLSFSAVRKAFLMEYDRRREQYLQSGKKLLEVYPPVME